MRQRRYWLTRRPLSLGAALLGVALLLALAFQALAPRVPAASAMPPRAPSVPRYAVAPGAPLARIPAGAGTIVQNGQAPFAAALYHIENHWFEVKNGQTIIVYAGMERQNPAQGVVIVEIASGDYTHVAGPFVYPTPRQNGSVHVAGATGERLTLANTQGATATFDVAHSAFVTP